MRLIRHMPDPAGQPHPKDNAMTTFDSTRLPSETGLRAGIVNLFAAIAAWNDARMTRKSLSKLSEHELEDIGLCRGDIEEVAARRSF